MPEVPEQNLIPINVLVAGRSYRLLVAREDEAFVRSSVKRINDQIAELRLHYAAKDEQDFVAMCLLMYAADRQGLAAQHVQDAAIQAMIAQIDKALDE